MKQLEYYLEQSHLDRQKQIGSCLGLFIKERMDQIREKAVACLKTQPEVTSSFEAALESGAKQAPRLPEDLPIVYVDTGEDLYLMARIDLVESLIRNGLCGVRLRPVCFGE